jgi:DNA-directed RNA polymerase subunit RPC12/RpoP
MEREQPLREYPVNPRLGDIWKTYPLRIPGYSLSKCCRQPTLLVQSMDGGFVSRNCPRCGKPTTLPESVFTTKLDLYVACPECKQRMTPQVLPDKNYGYLCRSCRLIIKLASLLPKWQDLT